MPIALPSSTRPRRVWLVGSESGRAQRARAALAGAGWSATAVASSAGLAAGAWRGDCAIVDLGGSSFGDDARQELQRLRDGGARLVVLLDRALAAAVVAALAGAAATLLVQPVEDARLVEAVAASLLRPDATRLPPPRGVATLTERESAILRRLLEGASSKQIAHELTLSPKTVSTHKGHILGKYRVDSVVALAALCRRAESG